MRQMVSDTRAISCIKTARTDFNGFSVTARDRILNSLNIISARDHPIIVKPLASLGAGVLELILRHRGDAYRVVYALQIETDIWVLHAFQKKSKTGIATPRAEIDLIRERINRLKEALR